VNYFAKFGLLVMAKRYIPKGQVLLIHELYRELRTFKQVPA